MRVSWWHSHFYLPRRASSAFIQRFPIIHGPLSDLARRVQAVNVYCPSEMCRVMTYYGSDKGKGQHNYTTVYAELFGSFRYRPLRIFELGLGTNNPNLI